MAKPPTEERLHKHLAGLGMASRRTIEGWIEQGKIRVDGRIAQIGEKVNAHSRISVDGRPLRTKFREGVVRGTPRIILYNKPEGEISTRKDPNHRPTIFRNLPKLRGQRWVAVGRLDINTRGLMLFTNDGEVANRLMHPRFSLEREYLCRIYGPVGANDLARLQQGIVLEGESMRFQEVRRQRGERQNCWYAVVVKEGRYREIRRMWEAVGCRVSRLLRVRYGDVVLPKTLKPGQWQELPAAKVAKLLRPVSAAGESPAPTNLAPKNSRGKHARKTSTKKASRRNRAVERCPLRDVR